MINCYRSPLDYAINSRKTYKEKIIEIAERYHRMPLTEENIMTLNAELLHVFLQHKEDGVDRGIVRRHWNEFSQFVYCDYSGTITIESGSKEHFSEYVCQDLL